MPSRQGTHLPQDSSARKSRKYRATSTMQVSSSMTIMPPEPIIAPALASSSKSTAMSSMLLGDAAARRAAGLDRLELLAARECRRRSRRRCPGASSPIGTSTRPVFLILPTREKIFVPLLFSVPNCVNQSAPLLMISGTLAQVSTLLRLVGLSQSPLTAVIGCTSTAARPACPRATASARSTRRRRRRRRPGAP